MGKVGLLLGLRVKLHLLCATNRVPISETLATTLVGLVSRIAAKITAYTYAFLINRMLNRPQGRIKELWART